jgi:hypothetical protein
VKVFHIPPGYHAHQLISPEVKGHLIVSNVFLNHQQYQEFYLLRAHADDWITVDSAAFEAQNTPAEDQLKVALTVNADEVILLDRYKDASGTVASSTNSYHILQDGGFTGGFMAVPQGKTFNEWLWCARQLATLSRVVCFGVIEEIQELYDIPRHIAVATLKTLYPERDIHLLGISENLDELFNPTMLEQVRSCDTAKFIVWGLNGMEIQPRRILDHPGACPPYPGRKTVGGRMGYFDYEGADSNAVRTVRRNIMGVHRYLAEKERDSGV